MTAPTAPATANTIPEPADGAALYWFGDADIIPALLIRDDSLADLSDAPALRWWAVNTADPGMTWQDALLWLAEQECEPTDGVLLGAVQTEPDEVEVRAAARALLDDKDLLPATCSMWDALSEREVEAAAMGIARAALTAAAKVRAGQAVTA